MRIVSKKIITLEEPIPVYDIIEAKPNNNFILENGAVVHNCALMDEIEFMKGQTDNLADSGVLSFYNAIKRRMQSRFLQDGKLPTTLFLVSSKQEQNNFLEQYAQTVANEPTTYIVDKPIWEIKPSTTYSGGTFRVAVGNKTVLSTLVRDDNVKNSELLEMGYEEILDVPIEYRSAFELDIKSALRDIAGKSTTDITKYISPHALRRCYTRNFENPFTQEILKAGIDDSHKISDYFRPDLVPENVKRIPGYIHVDIGLKHDKLGISYVVPLDTTIGNKYVNDAGTNFIASEEQVITMQVFSVGIKAEMGSEVSLKKVRDFFIYLKEKGFQIDLITYDGFQSADSIQLLKLEGFNALLYSLDRTTDGYDALRSSVSDHRIILPDLKESLLETELINIEKTPKGKIDHPMKGSKDISDSLAGANYHAIKNAQPAVISYTEYMEEIGEMSEEELFAGLVPDTNANILGAYQNVQDLLDNFDDLMEDYY